MFHNFLKIILFTKRFFLVFVKIILLTMALTGAEMIWSSALSVPTKIIFTIIFLAIWVFSAPKILSVYRWLFDVVEKLYKEHKSFWESMTLGANYTNQENPLKTLRAVIVFMALVIIGITAYILFGQEAYEWESPNYKVEYGDYVREYPEFWNSIKTTRLVGFQPNPTIPHYTLVEKNTGGWDEPGRCDAYDWDADYLRTEGGICRVGYWIEANDGSTTKNLSTFDDLWDIFNPIDDEAEAVSFVAAITEDLKTDANGVVEGYSRDIGGAYLVRVVRKNTFGCGSHEPTKVIYKISRTTALAEKAGDPVVIRIAAEKVRQPASGERLCAD